MLCDPVWNYEKVAYLAVPPGYRMWQKPESKREPAADMVRQVMPEFQEKKNVIILCDSWYVKGQILSFMFLPLPLLAAKGDRPNTGAAFRLKRIFLLLMKGLVIIIQGSAVYSQIFWGQGRYWRM